jgi:hypothetical protein
VSELVKFTNQDGQRVEVWPYETVQLSIWDDSLTELEKVRPTAAYALSCLSPNDARRLALALLAAAIEIEDEG